MGKLVDGKWHNVWYETKSTQGQFVRQDAGFRSWVTSDGAPGPTGDGGFAAERGRYHLYVSLACPWAHRTLLYRKLKGLEDHISVSVVHPLMLENGWSFDDDNGGSTDDLHGAQFLYDIYLRAKPSYTGRVTVPVLWDKQTSTIVSNESSEIIRMFDHAFDGVGARASDHRPPALQADIDEVNARIYETLNNGVYRAGFATTQEAYEAAFDALFGTMEWLEARLASQRYLLGNVITEADWRLFTTLVRFDAVYVGHFKCNKRKLVEHPNLWAYTRDLHQQPGVAETVNMKHIKEHYHRSHPTVNPTGIVPKGPDVDFSAPHDRARFG